MRLACVRQCERNAMGNARSLLEVRSKERTHLHDATHLPYAHRKNPQNHTRTVPLIPCIMLNSSAANRHPGTRARERRQQQNPTTKNHPQGAANMPITDQAQATALVNILHAIRATRGHGVADWHPKAIEKTLFENHTHQAPYGDIVVALTKYARDTDKRVPSFLWDALEDWAPPGQTAPRAPCEDHKTRAAANCPDCWSEVKTRMRPAELVGKHHPIQDTLDTAMSRKDTQ